MSTAIWWIRRDLRLSDNQALAAALHQADVVIPLFILDPHLISSSRSSDVRLGFLFDGLRALDHDLRKRSSALVIRQGDPLEVLHTLLDETGTKVIFAEADISPYAIGRDAKVMRELPLTLTPGVTVHPPEKLLKPAGAPYTIFTPFSRMWRSLPFPGNPLLPPDRFSSPPQVSGLAITGLPGWHPVDNFPAGELEAQHRLDRFIDSSISFYASQRDRLDMQGTSGLSPYFRFGMLSPRQAAWAAQEFIDLADDADARQGGETWLNELIWREFYAVILYHFPFVLQTAFKPERRSIPWRDDPTGFVAWTDGLTGYPVVDAAMRQLNATGWMHNRARMIAASFLTKDLLIDWRQGERYFMQHLVDGDPAANNGGWQWTAGTGTDAAPYFRIFNPALQGKKFDPQGAYVRQWVPELAVVPGEYIHTPWIMSFEKQEQLGCIIGKNYPAPIVDHAIARQRVLSAYRKKKLDERWM